LTAAAAAAAVVVALLAAEAGGREEGTRGCGPSLNGPATIGINCFGEELFVSSTLFLSLFLSFSISLSI
jgi:hypothetical protein